MGGIAKGFLEAEAGQFPCDDMDLPSLTKNDRPHSSQRVCVQRTAVGDGGNKSSPGLISK